jgi:hypothetical protein
MDWFVRAFVRSSVCWLAAGVTLGVAMAARAGAPGSPVVQAARRG